MVENDALVTIVDVPEISESLQVSCVILCPILGPEIEKCEGHGGVRWIIVVTNFAHLVKSRKNLTLSWH